MVDLWLKQVRSKALSFLGQSAANIREHLQYNVKLLQLEYIYKYLLHHVSASYKVVLRSLNKNL